MDFFDAKEAPRPGSNERKEEPPHPPQDVCLFSRKRMELTGIVEVESFSDQEIILTSSLGRVALDGEGLKIERLSTERGELIVNGKIDAFSYFGPEDGREKHGFLGRLFHSCNT